LPVYKMTGSGNDFVMIDARVSSPEEWTPSDIAAVCARGTGIGADGVVFLAPGAKAGAVRMIYFNSDGSRAAMCGNAALCSTRLATHTGLAESNDLSLETDAGTFEARVSTADARAELRFAPVTAPADVPDISLADGELRIARATVGVPHLVVLVRDLDKVPLAQRGRELRSHPALGPEGANANFVANGPGEREWRMRTYERGVEGETLACGTGAVAAACALDQWGLAKLPVALGTRSGRILEVRAQRARTGNYEDVWLVGEGRLVFRGLIT
jgi:diaminopimelate epimerase